MEWITISKNNDSGVFYPINLVGNALGKRLSYQECYKKPDKFWRDKLVLFHFIWKGPYVADCIKLWERIKNNSKQFWVEFDADYHMRHPHTVDFSIKSQMFLEHLADVSTGFIWEFSKDFNLFIKDTIRIPLRMYQRKWEKPIQKKKEIDFFFLIESRYDNAFHQIQLAKFFSKNYNVVCSVQQEEDYAHFRNLNLNILEKKATFPRTNFYKYLRNSKVVVNLSTRFTSGRTIYDSLFCGALSVCSKTYGASEWLYPDLVVDPFFMDLKEVKDLCSKTIKTWNEKTVASYRNKACNVAGLKETVKDLKFYAEKV